MRKPVDPVFFEWFDTLTVADLKRLKHTPLCYWPDDAVFQRCPIDRCKLFTKYGVLRRQYRDSFYQINAMKF